MSSTNSSTLSPEQQAVAMIGAGGSVTDAVDATGLDRTQIAVAMRLGALPPIEPAPPTAEATVPEKLALPAPRHRAAPAEASVRGPLISPPVALELPTGLDALLARADQSGNPRAATLAGIMRSTAAELTDVLDLEHEVLAKRARFEELRAEMDRISAELTAMGAAPSEERVAHPGPVTPEAETKVEPPPRPSMRRRSRR